MDTKGFSSTRAVCSALVTANAKRGGARYDINLSFKNGFGCVPSLGDQAVFDAEQVVERDVLPGKLSFAHREHEVALAYVSAQLGHANPSITLRIYSRWVPGTRRVSTAVLDTASANVPQMEALESEKEGSETTANR